MPYSNVPEELWPKMDDCVASVEESGKDKDAAIAICHAAIVKGDMSALKDAGFTLDKELSTIALEASALGFELSAALVDGREFDGMAEGVFTDMLGREVKLNGDYFAEFAANTNAAIMATKTDSGEIVGLPIDAQGHENGDGAGWIVAVSHIKRDGINILRITPRWTEIGRNLISSGVRRMFSPTVDTANRVILGGSLTNWPATRAKNGRLILRPIELSQKGVVTMAEEIKEVVEQTAEPVTAPATTPAPPATLEALLATDAISLQVREFVQAKIQEGVDNALQLIQAKASAHALAMDLTGGTPTAPAGLPVESAELEAMLLELPQASREKVVAMLTKIRDAGLLKFSETGHGQRLEHKAQLSDPLKAVLRAHLADGGTVDRFFEINQVDLGNKADYDLAEFETKKE